MTRAEIPAMARGLALLASLVMGGSMLNAGAADGYPEVSDLPSRPEMPDPLIRLDGTRVEDGRAWEELRKPELKALFGHYMYGVLPPAPPTIAAKVVIEDRNYFGGKATKKEVEIGFAPAGSPKIRLLLVVPNKRHGRAPAFAGANFNGNHTALADPTITLPTAWMPPNAPGVKDNRATDAGRGKDVGVWSIETVVDRGYALATCYAGDIAPDHPGFADGVFPAFAGTGQSARAGDEWGAVAAWAWGLSRVVDYLRTDPDIDPARIAVVGHSRMGKAAIVAGALDDRIALTIAHQAGCGGTAPSRGNFQKFNDQVDRLPFDQNCLIALAAPRPVLLTNATGDTWANPAGQFDALKGAASTYRLLGVTGIEETAMPPTDKLVGDRLGYHIRPGKHAMEPRDWTVFLDFADKHLKR